MRPDYCALLFEQGFLGSGGELLFCSALVAEVERESCYSFIIPPVLSAVFFFVLSPSFTCSFLGYQC
jgi:hypothetical protein